MNRHPGNHNLPLHYEPTYRGLRVMVAEGPLVEPYLARTHLTIQRALDEHPRTFAVRCDLRFPKWMLPDDAEYSNDVISSFFIRLKEIIKNDRRRAAKNNGYAHATSIRYVWAREVGPKIRDGRPHFHILLLLNRDAYNALGSFNSSQENLFKRIETAWCRALKIPQLAADGLVEVPNRATYYVDLGELAGPSDLFFRASYLCKAATKEYGEGRHCFDCSRI